MGNNIRIGKDFKVLWTINKVVDGERLPYILVGKELQLYIVNDNGRKEVAGWKVRGNVIEWTFLGKDQKRLGAYQLVLVENADKDGMVTVDTCKAFNLVAHSCEEDVEGGNGIVIETVTLESDVALAPVVKEIGGESYDEIKERIEEQDQLIEDLQNMKIDREADDYYPKLAVGLADNLAGVDVVHSEINFRRSGGGAITDGVARIEIIKGNSVVWNQLLDPTTQGNGRLNVYEENGKWVAEVTKIGDNSGGDNLTIPVIKEQNSVQGHKYIAILDITNDYSLVPAVKIGNKYATGTFHIIESSDSSTMYLYPFGSYSSPQIAQGSKAVLNVALFCDITRMFGAGNEPTTIEEFYARIPMGVDLNAYNEGEVIHMDVQGIESQGVNAWDEKWELGDISASTGEEDANESTIRTGFIKVIPNEKYFISIQGAGRLSMRARLYDYNKNFIGIVSASGADIYANEVFTMPSNARYIRFAPRTSVVSQSDRLCINIADASVNGKYFPYVKRVEDLSIIRKYFPEGMKSAGTAHDEIRYNKMSGRWERICRIGESDMGDFSWSYQSKSSSYPHGFFYTSLNSVLRDMKNGAEVMNAIYAKGGFADDKTIASNASNKMLYVRDSAYTDAASFKAAMHGIMLYYELAEPIVTELDEADQFKDLDYQVWNAGTEKAIAEGKSAPLAADITYGFNAIGKIKELESLVAALRAKVGI